MFARHHHDLSCVFCHLVDLLNPTDLSRSFAFAATATPLFTMVGGATGNIKHAGNDVISGERFILVGFYNADGRDRAGEEVRSHFCTAQSQGRHSHPPSPRDLRDPKSAASEPTSGACATLPTLAHVAMRAHLSYHPDHLPPSASPPIPPSVVLQQGRSGGAAPTNIALATR